VEVDLYTQCRHIPGFFEIFLPENSGQPCELVAGSYIEKNLGIDQYRVVRNILHNQNLTEDSNFRKQIEFCRLQQLLTPADGTVQWSFFFVLSAISLRRLDCFFADTYACEDLEAVDMFNVRRWVEKQFADNPYFFGKDFKKQNEDT